MEHGVIVNSRPRIPVVSVAGAQPGSIGGVERGTNGVVPRKGDKQVHDALLRQRLGRARFSPRERLAACCTVVGTTTVVITVILSATNAVSAQQSIAMGLPAGAIAMGGLLGLIVPDPWTAWRRGFRQGCEAALRSQPGDLDADVTTPKTSRERGRRSG
jgi:hypothetical protein